MGISRATIIAAIDRELGKGMIEWQAEATFPDGGVYVDGATPIFGDPPERTIRLFGPAGNVTGLELFDPPAATVKDARLSIAILNAIRPAAATWLRTTIKGAIHEEPLQSRIFDGISVGWSRHWTIFDGSYAFLALTGA
jgi:hypothetical protein